MVLNGGRVNEAGYSPPMGFPTDDDRRREADDQGPKAKNEAERLVRKRALVPMLLIVAAVSGAVAWSLIGRKSSGYGASAPTVTAAPPAPPAPRAVPEDEAAYECGGDMRVALGGQTMVVTGPGPAIRASGHCQLTLTNMNITAPVAIEARGNARVMIVGGSLSGSDKSIVASADAEVSVSGVRVSGDIEQSDRAAINGL